MLSSWLARHAAFFGVSRTGLLRHCAPDVPALHLLDRALTPGQEARLAHLFRLDRADALPVRLASYEAHKAYPTQAPIKSVISGPLMADDGETVIGSFFLVVAGSKDEVLAFHNTDPFKVAGIWEHVHINSLLKRVDNR